MEIKSVANQDLAKTTVLQSDKDIKASENKSQNDVENVKAKNNDKAVNSGDISVTSKDGDTVEISNTAKLKNQNETKMVINETSISSNTSKMSEAALAKCSKTKLKQLLQNGQISKQQYEKAMKKQSTK